MLTLAAFATLSLLFSGHAVAQVVAPDCLTVPWGWTFNSLNQNACTVAAYLMSTCNMGSFTINSLLPGYSYTGPSGVDDSNLCKCNTIAYSLISACDACQSETWITWSEYSFNCTRTLSPSTFPNPVPAGTRVPQWALLDVTLENSWNVNKSMAIGDSPEIGPGETISGLSASASTTAQSTGTSPNPTVFSGASSASASRTPTPTKSSSNVGAIAGGVVGGVAAISIAVVAVFFFLRRQRAKAPSSTYAVGGMPQPQMDEYRQPLSDDGTGTYIPPSTPGTPVTSMKLYDPSDPTTFPGYQPSGPGSDVTTPPPFSPYNTGAGAGNTLANMQTSAPGTPGYHGLPTV